MAPFCQAQYTPAKPENIFELQRIVTSASNRLKNWYVSLSYFLFAFFLSFLPTGPCGREFLLCIFTTVSFNPVYIYHHVAPISCSKQYDCGQVTEWAFKSFMEVLPWGGARENELAGLRMLEPSNFLKGEVQRERRGIVRPFLCDPLSSPLGSPCFITVPASNLSMSLGPEEGTWVRKVCATSIYNTNLAQIQFQFFCFSNSRTQRTPVISSSFCRPIPQIPVRLQYHSLVPKQVPLSKLLQPTLDW